MCVCMCLRQAYAEEIENLEQYKGLSRPTFLFYRVRAPVPILHPEGV